MFGVAGLTKWFLFYSCFILLLFILFLSFAMLLFSQRPCIFLFTVNWPVNCTNLWGVRGIYVFFPHILAASNTYGNHKWIFTFLKERHLKTIHLLSKEWDSYRLYSSKSILSKKRCSLSHFNLLSSVCVLSLLTLSSHLLSSAIILSVFILCGLSKKTYWQSF